MKQRLFALLAIAILAASGIAAEPPLISSEKLHEWAIYAPEPPYPFEAERLKHSGDGLYALRVHISSGHVKDAKIARSAGSPLLDASAMATLRRWQFKPGALRAISPSGDSQYCVIRVPVHFVLLPPKA